MVKTYTIKEEFKGLICCTEPPTYQREDGGKFYLTGHLSQKDLGYLYEVMKYEGISCEEVKEKEPKEVKKK